MPERGWIVSTPSASSTRRASRNGCSGTSSNCTSSLCETKVPVGAFVSQSELVQLLDVPLQPLRDALRVLEAEGVLTIHPRSGIQFLKPDLELARSTYQF